MRTSNAVTAVAEDARIRLLWDRLDLLREIDGIGNDLDMFELRFGRDPELQAVRQRQQAVRAQVCEQLRVLLGSADSAAKVVH